MRLRTDFKERRQEEAGERLAISGAMTPIQRLHALDERLGVNVGAKRERARLLLLISKVTAIEPKKKDKKAK